MNFQQLRSVREAVRQGFNLTTVAEALHTSQPGISRQIRELEDELGVEPVAAHVVGFGMAGDAALETLPRRLAVPRDERALRVMIAGIERQVDRGEPHIRVAARAELAGIVAVAARRLPLVGLHGVRDEEPDPMIPG